MNNWLSRYGDICGQHADKIYFGEMKDFRSKFKKIISYIWVVCFLIVGSHCMLHGNRVFFSIPYLPPSKPALLTLFFREIWRLFFVAHFGYNFIVYILVDYYLFVLPSKERYKEICPVVNLCGVFKQKTLKRFLCKKDPKNTLSDSLIFNLGPTNCFIANSFLSLV